MAIQRDAGHALKISRAGNGVLPDATPAITGFENLRRVDWYADGMV